MEENAFHLPLSDAPEETLFQPIRIGTKTLRNRVAVQPMEGCDGTPDGRPDALTERRYLAYASGGSALIWMEATAVCKAGRANPRQLWMCPENVDSFARLVEKIKERCMRENGYEPVVIMQDTHSGRYSKPEGVPEPLIAYHNSLFEKDSKISDDRILTDDELEGIEDKICEGAVLAQRAGFDGIDLEGLPPLPM